MMSLRAWIALLLFYIIYLLIGGFTFRAIESPHECETREKAFNESQKYQESLKRIRDHLDLTESHDLYEVWAHLNSSFLGIDTPLCDGEGMTWNFFNALFFSFTAITTIGFGHLSPATSTGKVICIVYSLLGVPVNGILIGSLGAFFGTKLNAFMKARPGGGSARGKNSLRKHVVLALQVLFFLVLGCIIFIVFPAIVFSSVEPSWNYLDAVYFAFITLTTIGFGDLVAGRNQETLNQLGGWKYFYLIGIVVWIILGLGFLIMIIALITEGLQKPAKKAVKRLAKAEKAVIARVLQEIQAEERKRKKNRSKLMPEDLPDEELNAEKNVFPKGFENAAYHPSPVRAPADSTMINAQGSKTDLSSSEQDLIEEMNHDTITSLRHFVQSSGQFSKRASMLKQHEEHQSNNGSSLSSKATRKPIAASASLRSSSFSENRTIIRDPASSINASRAASIHGGEAELNSSWRKIVKRKFSLTRISNASNGSSSSAQISHDSMLEGLSELAATMAVASSRRKASASMPEILRETTLEEFLQAVERVKAQDSCRLLADITDDKINVTSVEDDDDYSGSESGDGGLEKDEEVARQSDKAIEEGKHHH